MLTLKISERGHVVNLPGMAEFRTPANIDVSKIPLNVLILKLRTYNINHYEIISELGSQKVVYKKEELEKIKTQKLDKKYIKHIDKRLNKLEGMIKILTESKPDIGLKGEQIKNILEEVISKNVINTFNKLPKKEKDIKEDEKFIPPVNIGGMKLKSSEHIIIKQKENLEDSANLLSELHNNKKRENE